LPQHIPNEDKKNNIIQGNTRIVKTVEGIPLSNKNEYARSSRAHKVLHVPRATSNPGSEIRGNLIYGNDKFTKVNEFSLELKIPLLLSKVNIESFPNFNKISSPIKNKIKNAIKGIRDTGKYSNSFLGKIIIKSNVTHNIGFMEKEYTFSYNGKLFVNIDSMMLIDDDNNISLLPKERGIVKVQGSALNSSYKSLGEGNVTGFLRSDIGNFAFENLKNKLIIPSVIIDDDVNSHINKSLKRHEEKIKEHFEISSSLAIKIKKYLISDSQLRKLSVDEVSQLFQRTFFKSLGFYQSLIVRNGIKKYIVYENNKFDFHIDMYFSKKFPIEVTYRPEVYEELYEELLNFLKNGDIRIGKFGKLTIEAGNIIIVVNKDLKQTPKMTPVKSKKLRLKKNEK